MKNTHIEYQCPETGKLIITTHPDNVMDAIALITLISVLSIFFIGLGLGIG